MITRILPPEEWPRIAETGCLVDKAWAARAQRGCVVVVELGRRLIATAFVFCAEDATPHVDGLWIADGYRGRVSLLRALHRGIKFVVDQLGGGRVPIGSAAAWMTRPERRAHGIEL